MRARLAALAFVATTAVVAACDDAASPTPIAQLSRIDNAGASLLTHHFPTIQFGNGITNDMNSWYVSTGSGFRPTYVIDPTTSTITGTIAGGFSPRDLVWMWPDRLALSDVDSFVSVRSISTGAVLDSLPIPWRGGGIARWSDTLYVGDQDHDSILAMYYSPFIPSTHIIARSFEAPMRPEALVIDSVPLLLGQATLWGLSMFDSYLYHFDLRGNLIEKCLSPYQPGPFGLGGLSIHRDSFLIAHPTGGDPMAGTTIHRIARNELVCGANIQNDTIDIIPGRFPNRIHPHAGSRIEVAAITTPSRDATTLILATVRFGRTGTEALPLSSALRDVDGDGDIDVVYEFRQRDAGFVCGDVVGRLRANTTVGAPFDGIDQVVIAPGCRP
jgi:hypothetical protein